MRRTAGVVGGLVVLAALSACTSAGTGLVPSGAATAVGAATPTAGATQAAGPAGTGSLHLCTGPSTAHPLTSSVTMAIRHGGRGAAGALVVQWVTSVPAAETFNLTPGPYTVEVDGVPQAYPVAVVGVITTVGIGNCPKMATRVTG